MRQLVVICAFLAVVYSQEHFIDVRELVRDTLDAIKEVASNDSTVTSVAKPTVEATTSETATMVKASEDNDVYKSLLKLPADIMSRLAYGAGFIEPKKESSKLSKKIEEAQPSKQPQDDAPAPSTEDRHSSFKTSEDEERPRVVTSTAGPAKIIDDDVFSISKLISATGNAIREAQAQQAALAKQQEPATLPPLVPLPQPLAQPLELPAAVTQNLPLQQSEVVYRPVVRDGKTVFEQIVLLKSADGTTKIISQNIYPTVPVMPEVKTQKPKNMKSTGSDFAAPEFPGMVNVFDQFSSTSATEEPTTTTTTTTTEEPTTAKVLLKPRKKSLPRRTINYMGKKVQDMHSRQFGAKTVQMSEPIDFDTQRDEAPNVLEKEGSLRVRTINRKRKYRKTLIKKVSPKEEQLDEAEIAEIPKKRKRVIRRKNIKKVEEAKEKKEIRRFPDLYDEQQKIEVAPSVSPATEDFTEQFKDVDEVQQQVKPQNDSPIESTKKEEKVELTAKQQEDVLDKEIHKRVLKRIQSARTRSAEVVEKDEEEYDEQPSTTTTTTLAPVKKTTKKIVKKVLITRQQCLNLRSFARQFLFDSVAEFAKEHCYFIENYYPNLKCEKVDKYITRCQKLVKDDE